VIPDWSAADQLLRRFLELIYTVVLSAPLGAGLMRLRGLFGFEQARPHRRSF
jgi:hypothetical protein